MEHRKIEVRSPAGRGGTNERQPSVLAPLGLIIIRVVGHDVGPDVSIFPHGVRDVKVLAGLERHWPLALTHK